MGWIDWDIDTNYPTHEWNDEYVARIQASLDRMVERRTARDIVVNRFTNGEWVVIGHMSEAGVARDELDIDFNEAKWLGEVPPAGKYNLFDDYDFSFLRQQWTARSGRVERPQARPSTDE